MFMKSLDSPETSGRVAAVPGLRRRRAFWQWMRAVALGSDRARQRRTLAELDDRLLADIGLSRADVAREIAKPFWQ